MATTDGHILRARHIWKSLYPLNYSVAIALVAVALYATRSLVTPLTIPLFVGTAYFSIVVTHHLYMLETIPLSEPGGWDSQIEQYAYLLSALLLLPAFTLFGISALATLFVWLPVTTHS